MHRTSTHLRAEIHSHEDGSKEVTLHAHVAHSGEDLPPGQVTFHGFGAATVSANLDHAATHCRQAWCARITVDPENVKETFANYEPGDDKWRGSKSEIVTL